MIKIMKLVCIAVTTLSAIAAAHVQAADAYPSKPIKIVVPFPPGGTADSVARVLANGLREKLGQTVLVENRAGGGTIIGTQHIAQSEPDGYNLILQTTPFAINVSLHKTLPYDTHKGFITIVDVVSAPLVLIVHPSSPAKTLADLVKQAKDNAGKVTYGSSGNGGSPHLTSELFAMMADIKLVHVPYKGSAPAVADLIGGQTNMVFDTLFLVTPQVKSGKARALAQTGATRSHLLPDVPTMQEAGLSNFTVATWYKLAAPAGTPADIIARLNKATNEVLQSPSVQENFAKQGLNIVGGSAEDSAKHLRSEIEKWSKVVQKSGARAD